MVHCSQPLQNKQKVHFLNEKGDIIKSRSPLSSPQYKWYYLLQENKNPDLNMGKKTPTAGNTWFSC